MSEFVESLRRLYVAGKITEEKVKTLFTKGTIKSSEYVYITKGQK